MGHVSRRAPVAVLMAVAVLAGATASGAQAEQPAIARVDALAVLAHANVGLFGIMNQVIRDAIAAHASLRPKGDHVVTLNNALITQNTAIVKDDARVKADQQKLRRDQQQLKSATGERAAMIQSAIAAVQGAMASAEQAAAKQAMATAKRLEALLQQLDQFVDLARSRLDRARSRFTGVLDQLNNTVRGNTNSMQQLARSRAAGTV